MNMQWVTLFSQTGSEIVKLQEHLGRWPDVIFTNNSDVDTWHPEMQKFHKQGKDSINGKSRVRVVTNLQARTCNFLHTINKESLITLHGWLRIVPENICEQYNIVNGHPGLITAYPQLKGKDPQVRAYEDNYGVIGSVVHKVTPEVDDGEVLTYTAIYRQNKDTLDDVFEKLAFTSFKSWQKFFSDIK
jgi:folate-dependent phosphoribosylglycinamide formyltransferase PurN